MTGKYQDGACRSGSHLPASRGTAMLGADPTQAKKRKKKSKLTQWWAVKAKTPWDHRKELGPEAPHISPIAPRGSVLTGP